MAVQFLCSFWFGLVVALYYAWQLALVVCAAVPVFGVIIAFAALSLTSSTERAASAYNDAGSLAQEALGSVRTVYGFNGEKVSGGGCGGCGGLPSVCRGINLSFPLSLFPLFPPSLVPLFPCSLVPMFP
jgi:hypothetical protein